ncbi:acyltransferase family protein [uncultured Roseobacter sp.]|uniref:acyltransferase family protein n=1 Tax=uncultured Roseobacter sp. TaxID=114847 RepID=UPI0026243AC9|nr:acyltransferase family protein [uncultured Roseobacter sp.]
MSTVRVQQTSPSHGYRPEIDGLRTIAVVPVVLYHAGVSWMSGGFVGVDVFFVISGFLITGILFQDIQRDRFSLLTFYERRIRRIFPALFTVFAVSMVLASGLLLWDEFNEFARSLFFSTFFLANHYFMGDTGYFAGAAEVKPLLHMWSLAVEEQFYIVFPVYLLIVAKYRQSWLLPLTALLLVLSLVFCIILTGLNPDTAFYIAPTRAWELLAGALLAILPRRFFATGLAAQIIGALGLGAIFYAILNFDHGTVFPGSAAIVPVLGTVAIIYSSTRQVTAVGAFLSLAPMRFVGLISYSLYLWHWPLIVFYRFWRLEEPEPVEMYGIVLLSVVMATLSWHFVERPFRTRSLLATRKSTLTFGVVLMMVFGAVALVVDLKDGFINRYPPAVNAALSLRHDSWRRDNCSTLGGEGRAAHQVCTFGPGAPDFAVWGDSHAGALLPAFVTAAEQVSRAGASVGNSGCLPFVGVQRRNPEFANCAEGNQLFLEYIRDTPTIEQVFLVSRWGIYAQGRRLGNSTSAPVTLWDAEQPAEAAGNHPVFERGLVRTIEALQAAGKRVILVSQVPDSPFDVPSTVARALWLDRPLPSGPLRAEVAHYEAFVRDRFVQAEQDSDVRLMRLGDIFCPGERCVVWAEGVPFYRDGNHLTIARARSLAPVIRPYLVGAGE